MTKKTKGLSTADKKIYQSILSIFRNEPRSLFNYKQIAHRLKSNTPELRQTVERVIRILEREELIEQQQRGKFRYVPEFSIFTGIVQMTQRGIAFVYNEELDLDIRISPSLTGTAFNGDLVTVELLDQTKGRKAEGRIIEIVERDRHRFVGTLEKFKKFAYVIPDNNKIHVDFYIPQGKLKDARNGDKVVIEFTSWPTNFKQPHGKVIEVLGPAGEHETEMHAIISEFGFTTEFTPRAVKESLQCPDIISKEEIALRRDMRDTLTFTIDPVDAKDFDDALSFRKLDNGLMEIGVHIADVSHYVTRNSALDMDAYDRGTSVYLVDRTIPMLPERLSNDLCSLKPNVDRLAFSVIFKMNEKAEVSDYEICKTIIHSDRRFSYEEAQEVIEGHSEELGEVIPALNRLAHILRERRFKEGAIGFESDEFRFELDEQGKPLRVMRKIRKDAHKMIEEFMLLANRTVARHVFKKMNNAPIPHRVHESPVPEKLELFVAMAKKFGYHIDTSSDLRLSQSINKMVEETEDRIESSILHPLAIRSMEKAFYTSQKTGHFGLAFDFYTHFTSPIRRYPDLLVHRLLYRYLQGDMSVDRAWLEKACHQSSRQEEKAAKAERASVKYKQTEYLSQFVGDQFEGIVSGVTEWGLYVELKANHCEGMVRIKDIQGDYYEYYEKEIALVGRRTGNRYTIGDEVDVRIKKTNLHKRTVDLELLNV
ncbi:MAG: ribonuclease R [Flavobacteriales bacterium]|nr:ribonuclease R [Flavobacteriales bacterium]